MQASSEFPGTAQGFVDFQTSTSSLEFPTVSQLYSEFFREPLSCLRFLRLPSLESLSDLPTFLVDKDTQRLRNPQSCSEVPPIVQRKAQPHSIFAFYEKCVIIYVCWCIYMTPYSFAIVPEIFAVHMCMCLYGYVFVCL